jgi:hypothetical protein
MKIACLEISWSRRPEMGSDTSSLLCPKVILLLLVSTQTTGLGILCRAELDIVELDLHGMNAAGMGMV